MKHRPRHYCRLRKFGGDVFDFVSSDCSCVAVVHETVRGTYETFARTFARNSRPARTRKVDRKSGYLHLALRKLLACSTAHVSIYPVSHVPRHFVLCRRPRRHSIFVVTFWSFQYSSNRGRLVTYEPEEIIGDEINEIKVRATDLHLFQ